MRWAVLLLALVTAACGGSDAQCEQVGIDTGPDGHPIFRITCVHECGLVLVAGYWDPGPSCEWQQNVCRERCATP